MDHRQVRSVVLHCIIISAFSLPPDPNTRLGLYDADAVVIRYLFLGPVFCLGSPILSRSRADQGREKGVGSYGAFHTHVQLAKGAHPKLSCPRVCPASL